MKSQFEPNINFFSTPACTERLTHNYYSFPQSDTFFISGIRGDTLSFMYEERKARVFAEKLYLTNEYYWKIYMQAFMAKRKISERGDIDPMILNTYKLKISIFNQQFKESPAFVWNLYELW